MLTSMLFIGAALAGDCDVPTMSKEILEVGPHEAAPMFVQLAGCDAKAAAKVAPKVIPTLIGESDGFDAANAAIEAGAGASVMTWLEGLQQDERSRAVRSFGKRCNESQAVQGFLIEAEGALGQEFWTGRWYRALTECRAEGITALLSAKVDAGAADDRSGFFGVVEAYAVNVGAQAIPKLVALVEAESDLEMQINLVGAFADAAQAGTVSGLNAQIAEQAATAVRELAPKLEAKAVDKARITLNVLLDEEGSDTLVAVRYKDRLQDDATLLYAAVVFENATCKNGKSTQRLHVADVTDPGQTWPDQLLEKVQSTAELTWTMNLAERCKGEGEVRYFLPDDPFADKDAQRQWMKDTIRKNAKPDVKNAGRVDEETISL